MNLLRIFFICAVLTGVGIISCKKSEPACGSFGWSFAFQDEINNLSIAATAYGQNNTPENCQAYKQAYIKYIDALKGWEHCLLSELDRDDWHQALNEAEQEVINIQC
jgi:hypothetical protein